MCSDPDPLGFSFSLKKPLKIISTVDMVHIGEKKFTITIKDYYIVKEGPEKYKISLG